MKNKNMQNSISQSEDDVKSLSELLNAYCTGGTLPFHMPGHKRADFEFLQGMQKTDITEIAGFDNLHDATGIIKYAQERAAKVFGVLHSRFLVNGSTCGILAGIRALCNPNDKILIARNCHKSVYNAVELSFLKPRYVMPKFREEYGFYADVLPEDIDAALSDASDIKLVVITSPSYEGVISDVKTIAEVCHKHGALLFVDEAHGAHLGFDGFENSARTLGADIVVNSLHKTLPSLTQTALLHICTDSIDSVALDKNLAVFQSSSPSYLLMSSIDGCVRYLQSQDALKQWSENLDRLREKLTALKNFRLFEGDSFSYDKSKLVFLCDGCDATGVEAANYLRKKHGIEVEMSGANHFIAMTGAGDDAQTFDLLYKSICALDGKARPSNKSIKINCNKMSKKIFDPYQIDGLNVELADIESCHGKISAENIWAYPPGCPIVVKGEIIDAETADCLTMLSKSGVNVSSEYRRFPAKVAVVCDDGENKSKLSNDTILS